MEDVYDVVILGGGPAGLTAAIYAGRYNHKTLVIAKSVGGTANLAGEVENWPGYIGPGSGLMRTVRDQAERFGAEVLEDEVKTVKKNKVGFVLNVGERVIYSKTLIVALGTEHRQLNIPGEKEFLGRGVSYCATCDGNFFRKKTVAVVGGANSAAKAAIYLADICEKVYVIYRKHEMRCEPVSLSKICKTKNIEIKYFATPTEVVGDKVVEGLKIKTEEGKKSVGAARGIPSKLGTSKEVPSSSSKILDVDGVFIEVGATPANEVVKELKLKLEKNYIVTGKDTKTNVDGVFAAGDVTNNALKQMINAAGEGAIAAKSAHEFILGK